MKAILEELQRVASLAPDYDEGTTALAPTRSRAREARPRSAIFLKNHVLDKHPFVQKGHGAHGNFYVSASARSRQTRAPHAPHAPRAHRAQTRRARRHTLTLNKT